MGKAVITGAGGGGAGSDECTATKAEILKGYKAITKDSDDELTDGTLELTGTAADSQVLFGQTYYNTEAKTKRTGVMANRGAVTQALNAGDSYTIPAGYHNGFGKVTANGLAAQTGGNATAAQILSGQTAWVNGSKVTGNMANQGSKTAALNCGGTYTIPEGYHDGSGKIAANSLASQTGGATADDSKVLNGYTYWKDGVKRNGSLAVTSIVSFSVAQYSNLTLIASWAKPVKGPWSGVRIMCRQGGYSSSVSDGTLFYEGSGTSGTKSLSAGTWYFRAWNYITTSAGRIYGEYSQTTCNNAEMKGIKTFTSSGTFTVPSNVRSIDVFCVGGGGGGGGGGHFPNPAGGGGGGAGYAVTKTIAVTPGQTIAVTIGGGGYGGRAGSNGPGGEGGAGGTTSFGSVTASGGGGGNRGGGTNYFGGNGGSGGGGGGDYVLGNGADSGGTGGTNGGNGSGSSGNGGSLGYGKGSTTRAFNEPSNTLYAGGGGGGASTNSKYSAVGGNGGSGGGGRGGNGSSGRTDIGSAGANNTGSGGGGGAGGRYSGSVGGNGGTGIVTIRWGY